MAVKDPKRSARWWISRLGMTEVFTFDGGVAVGNDAVTIALFKGTPRPHAFAHMSFHMSGMRALRSALAHLKRQKVDIEDPGDEIGPEAEGSRNMGLWFRDPDGYRWELSVIAKRPKRRRRRLAKP